MGSRVSVVIVNWNARDFLPDSIESVLADASGAVAEIIVIDNASTDGSGRLVRSRFPTVRLIENRENFGFARASNQGILASGGDYILLLNPDARLRIGALERLVKCLDARADAGACGPQILDGTGIKVPVATAPRVARMLFTDTFAAKLFPSCMASPRHFPTVETPVQTLSGCCVLLRRQAVVEVGLLNERIFLYYEETELLERLRRSGWKAYFVPGAEAVHLGERSTSRLPNWKKLLIDKQSTFELWRSRYGPAGAGALKGIQFFLVLLTVAGLALRLPFRRGADERHKMRFYLAFLHLIAHDKTRVLDEPGWALDGAGPDGPAGTAR